ncbi:MAG: mitochondrial fission ELM1 family protein [Rhodospirillales bacterium]|nr:mitochondrial fission ELM1 family protein [Rhodospirillales bacterium]MCB9996048.1 mitochondrial fission ELM1 family protein [Rhodospirillales bacterium]
MTSCWIVTEGIAGTENQCLGVAEALGVMPEIKRIGLRQPWKSLSPYLGFECGWSFTGDALTAPWPDLLLASGRKAIAAARYIKRMSSGKTLCVQIQDPRVNPAQFDLVAVPAHDPARGENVIVTSAAPNRITAQRLADARDEFTALLSPLPAPRVAVMIGGNSKAYTMSADITRKLADDLKALSQSGYSLMVTASRRTGDVNGQILKDVLKGENIYYWDGSGDNPYFGFLAWADFILVTADSVSMLSEAASTGKPVYMIPLEGGSKRLELFHGKLTDDGVIRRFDGTLTAYDYTKLDDAGLIAAEIRKRLGKV